MDDTPASAPQPEPPPDSARDTSLDPPCGGLSGGEHVEPQPSAPAEQPAQESGVSTARKIRLAVLVLILVGMAAGAWSYRAGQRRAEEARRAEIQRTVDGLRQAVSGLDPRLPSSVVAARLEEIGTLWEAVGKLDPENHEARRLGVAVAYAMQNFGMLTELFNEFDARAIARETNPRAWGLINQVLQAYPGLQMEAVADDLQPKDEDYLKRTGFFWSLSQSICRNALTDTDKALAICRWMALHVAPARPDDPPANPYDVLGRVRASPAEAVWTYAELARQAGVHCLVAVPQSADGSQPAQWLVQVQPGDGAAFYVNPHQGVPLADPESGRLLTPEDFAHATPACGMPAGMNSEELASAVLQWAIYPNAVFARFQVLDYLLSVMPVHPAAGFDADRAADRFVLWPVCLDILGRAKAGPASPDVFGGGAPLLWMQAQWPDRAGDACRTLQAEIEAVLAQAEVAETAAMLREGIEYARFMRAMSAFDAGYLPQAKELLRAYLQDYPNGRWRVPVLTLQAEALQLQGDPAAADAWRDLPAERRCFGQLRQKGLLAPAASAAGPAGAGPPVP